MVLFNLIDCTFSKCSTIFHCVCTFWIRIMFNYRFKRVLRLIVPFCQIMHLRFVVRSNDEYEWTNFHLWYSFFTLLNLQLIIIHILPNSFLSQEPGWSKQKKKVELASHVLKMSVLWKVPRHAGMRQASYFVIFCRFPSHDSAAN